MAFFRPTVGLALTALLSAGLHCLDTACAALDSACTTSAAAMFLAQAPPFSERRLMDSGQSQCYDAADAPIPCAALTPGAAAYGQDAHYINFPAGRDLQSGGDGTILDRRAGLQWTQCSVGPGNALLSGPGCDNDASAVPAAYNHAAAQSTCSTLEHAGHSDWRLPQIQELLRLVDAAPATGPLVDTALFPNTSGLGYASASLDPAIANSNFQLRADDAAVVLNSVFTSSYVRCVRGEVRDYGPYWTRGAGATLDLASGLYWQGCARGQAGAACDSGAPILAGWLEALDYCETLQWAGRDDWRLPAYAELSSLVRFTASGVRIDAGAFPAAGFSVWSSTSNPDAPAQAVTVDFANATIETAPKSDVFAVRCVAGP